MTKLITKKSNRGHTFVAGHLYYYNYMQTNGVDYITMRPTGGKSTKEGTGNVEHIMWVTMANEGPVFDNILLEGVFDLNGRDQEIQKMYDRTSSN